MSPGSCLTPNLHTMNDPLERTQAGTQLTCGARGASPARRTFTLKPQGGLLATAPVVAGIREAGVLRCKTGIAVSKGRYLQPLPIPRPTPGPPAQGHFKN